MDNINYAKFSTMKPKFFGADLTMIIAFLLLFFLHMRLWTFLLLLVVFTFSLILDLFFKISFVTLLKKIRVGITFSKTKKIRIHY